MKLLGSLLVTLFLSFAAQAASVNVTVNVPSAPSTSVSCGGNTFTFTGPVAAGTAICPVVVEPSTWAGSLALSGTDASSFALQAGSSGVQLVVGAAGLSVNNTNSYSVTITATP